MFILAEDEALKAHLQDIVVSDRKNATRPVTVYFRFPNNEPRDAEYPLITLDLLDIVKADRREHRGYIKYGYTPDEPEYEQFVNPEGVPDGVIYAGIPVPYDLVYLISTYTRDPLHDRHLQRAMMRKLPQRDAIIEIEADQTYRRVVVRPQEATNHRDQYGNRIFQKRYIAVIESELPPTVANAATEIITNLRITINHQQEIEQEPEETVPTP